MIVVTLHTQHLLLASAQDAVALCQAVSRARALDLVQLPDGRSGFVQAEDPEVGFMASSRETPITREQLARLVAELTPPAAAVPAEAPPPAAAAVVEAPPPADPPCAVEGPAS